MNVWRIALVKLFFHGCYVRLWQAELINSQSTNLPHFYHSSFGKLFVPKMQSIQTTAKNRFLSSTEAAPLLSHRGYIRLQNYPTPFLLVEITEFAKSAMTKNSVTHLLHSSLLTGCRITLQKECVFWLWKMGLTFPLSSTSSLVIFHVVNHLGFASWNGSSLLTLPPLSRVLV